ncbi:hypothetical protein [uncultured Pseudacidovorax sp.]|uniref:hypothetical protein n=1 Tax=uncultured Pseudacidovorax sp. TaxID=679313 RepID=UPI0025F8EA7F|nr:hypothetical protein [uncultured Pseudacidovorax sp.]
MIQLELISEGASLEQLQTALQVANEVFAQADIDPYDAFTALALVDDWGGRGVPEDSGLSERESRALDAFLYAEAAASDALRCRDGAAAMLSFREV